MRNKIKWVRATKALQEPAGLLQHLFYFIAHETTPLNKLVQENFSTNYGLEETRTKRHNGNISVQLPAE